MSELNSHDDTAAANQTMESNKGLITALSTDSDSNTRSATCLCNAFKVQFSSNIMTTVCIPFLSYGPPLRTSNLEQSTVSPNCLLHYRSDVATSRQYEGMPSILRSQMSYPRWLAGGAGAHKFTLSNLLSSIEPSFSLKRWDENTQLTL